MKKCTTCNGEKYSSQMGGLREKCKPCNAKGFIVQQVIDNPDEKLFKEKLPVEKETLKTSSEKSKKQKEKINVG